MLACHNSFHINLIGQNRADTCTLIGEGPDVNSYTFSFGINLNAIDFHRNWLSLVLICRR